MEMKFSIVVVCLNAGWALNETINSILMQSDSAYEIVVKDGMSSDGSVEGLPSDDRIRVVRQKDTGIYDAMNQAVREVTGDYVYFLNCGDVFCHKDVLRRVRECIESEEKNNAGQNPAERDRTADNGSADGSRIFYGDIYDRMTGERVASNPSMDAFGCYRNVPCHQACFYGIEWMRKKPFDTAYKVRADYEHFLWCFFEGKAKMVYMPFLIADYEGGGFSETKENLKRSAEEHREITAKYMSAWQRFKYRMIMALTLASFRTWLAHNEKTAHGYQWLKRKLYRG